MTEVTPLYMDINNAYSGDELGLPWRDLMGEGIVAVGDLAVSAGSGNSVDVAAGGAWVLGDTNAVLQPNYRVYNDGIVNKGITPDATNPRYVLVVAQITDAAFSGASRNWAISAIHGTPAASPVVPATPASALPLAQVLVPTNAASSAAYTITDLRTRTAVSGGQAQATMPLKFADVLLTGTSASIDIQNIPATHQGLLLLLYWRVSAAVGAQNVLMRFNNDAVATNYDVQQLAGSAATASAFEQFGLNAGIPIPISGANAPANVFLVSAVEIPNYANSTNNKSLTIRNGQKTGVTTGSLASVIRAGFWRSNAAINRITFVDSGATNFVAGTRALLYLMP